MAAKTLIGHSSSSVFLKCPLLASRFEWKAWMVKWKVERRASGRGTRNCWVMRGTAPKVLELRDFVDDIDEVDALLACAVERRAFLAGANPARRRSLQPVATGDGRGCRYSRFSSAPTRSHSWGDRHALESVIGMGRNPHGGPADLACAENGDGG